MSGITKNDLGNQTKRSPSRISNLTTNAPSNKSSNHTTNLQPSQTVSSNKYNENKQNNQTILYQDPFYPFLGNKKLLEDQKEYFKDKGQISDKYLLP